MHCLTGAAAFRYCVKPYTLNAKNYIIFKSLRSSSLST